jgi:hypothetical protein
MWDDTFFNLSCEVCLIFKIRNNLILSNCISTVEKKFKQLAIKIHKQNNANNRYTDGKF